MYLSTPCNDAIIGKDYIKAAIHALFATNTLGSSEGSVEPNTEDKKSETRPIVLWSCVYVQELAQVHLFHHGNSDSSVCVCNLNLLSISHLLAILIRELDSLFLFLIFTEIFKHCRVHLVRYVYLHCLMSMWTTGI